jgi:hypothetical protein
MADTLPMSEIHWSVESVESQVSVVLCPDWMELGDALM